MVNMSCEIHVRIRDVCGEGGNIDSISFNDISNLLVVDQLHHVMMTLGTIRTQSTPVGDGNGCSPRSYLKYGCRQLHKVLKIFLFYIYPPLVPYQLVFEAIATHVSATVHSSSSVSHTSISHILFGLRI